MSHLPVTAADNSGEEDVRRSVTIWIGRPINCSGVITFWGSPVRWAEAKASE